MAADPSQLTQYVTLNQSSDIASGVSADSIAGTLITTNGQGHGVLGITSVAFNRVYVCRATSGVAEVDSQFLPPDRFYQDEDDSVCIRGEFNLTDTFYWGECAAPTLTLTGKGVVITNNNAATIYWRKGTANTQGLTIAKPGDTNGDNVQGTPLYAYERLVLTAGIDYTEGEYLHLLGTAAAQKATIQLL